MLQHDQWDLNAMKLPTLSLRTLLLCLALITAVGCDNKTPQEHIEDAKTAITAGELNVAIIELKNALQKDANSLSARAMLGKLRMQQGDIQAAARDLERAIDLGTEDEETRVAYLRTKTMLGNHLAVVGELEGTPGLSPAYAAVLGEAYLAARDLAGARAQFQQALNLPEGLLGISQVAFYENDAQRAYKYIQQALDKSPDFEQALLFKGELELVLQDADAALATFDKARKFPVSRNSALVGVVRAQLLAEDLPAASKAADQLISSTKKYPYAHFLKGLIAYRQKDYQGAERALGQARRLSGDDPGTLRLLAIVKYELGEKAASERLLRRYLTQDSADLSVRKLLARIMSERSQHAEVIELLQPVATQHADPQIWAMLGNALMQTGEASSAAEAYESAVEIAPDMAVFRNQLALSLLGSGDNQGATEQLTAAVELDDDSLQSEYLLVLTKIRDRDFTGATKVSDGLVADTPDNPVGYHLKGLIAASQQDAMGAKDAFKEAVEKDPTYFPSAHALAQIATQEGKQAEARAYYERLRTATSDDVRASIALARLDIQAQDINGALARLEEAITQFPESPSAHTALARVQMATGQLEEALTTTGKASELAGDTPDILFLKADVQLRLGQKEAAEVTGEQLQSLAASFAKDAEFLSSLGALQLRLEAFTSARQNLLSVLEIPGINAQPILVNLVNLELAEQNPRRAQSHLDQLLNAGQANEQVALLQGDIYLASDRVDQALNHYRSMSQEGSRSATLKAGMLFLQSARYAEGDQFLSDWVEQNGADAGVQALIASAKVQLGDLDAAKARYEAMMPTNNPTTLNNLAWIYLNQGDRRALTLAEKAHKLIPNNPDIQDTLGWILVKYDRAEEALALLEASAKLRSGQGAVQYHLGMAYLQLGEQAKAAAALKKAIDLGGFDELAEAEAALRNASQS